MTSKIQRMRKKLAELLSSQEKFTLKAQEAGANADQLKRDIHFEENNAIATKIRETGINPEELDALIAQYLITHSINKGDNGQNNETVEPIEPENIILSESENNENKEDLVYDSQQ